MLIIIDEQYRETPVKMSSIHTGVKKMIIQPNYAGNERCIIMADNKGPFFKTNFYWRRTK